MVKLIGEGEYNLNVLKEIRVTSDFLGLDQDDRKCQNEEPLINCTTRQYHHTLLKKCGCLPVNIGLLQKVQLILVILMLKCTLYPRKLFALLQKSWTVLGI